MTIEIKDFKDFSVDEIREVLNLIYSEGIKIENISGYDEEEGYFEVEVVSFWTTKNDSGEFEDVELNDNFYLSNSTISSDDFPITEQDHITYVKYLKAHGYLDISENDNQFIKDIKSDISFTENLDEFLIRKRYKVKDLTVPQLVEYIKYRNYDDIAQIILKLIQYTKDDCIGDLNKPKKPITKEWCSSKCPTCNKTFEDYEHCDDGYYKRAFSLERCPYCGQKLDW